jgi:hypothetical protein
MSRRTESVLRQLTVRGFESDLERRLRALARSERISLNEAALRLLRRGAGLERQPDLEPPEAVGSALDHLAGTWSEADVAEFAAAVRPTEQIDDSFWASSGRSRRPRRSRR